MVEYPVLQDAPDCCEDGVQFAIGGVDAWAWFVFMPGGDNTVSNLETPTATLSLRLRSPTPTSLAGFSFTCQASIP